MILLGAELNSEIEHQTARDMAVTDRQQSAREPPFAVRAGLLASHECRVVEGCQRVQRSYMRCVIV